MKRNMGEEKKKCIEKYGDDYDGDVDLWLLLFFFWWWGNVIVLDFG